MKKIFRFFLILVGLASLILIIFSLSMTAGFSFRKSDQKTEKYFQEANVPFEIVHQSFEEKEVRWIEVPASSSSQNLMIFIHGAPGGADAFYPYMADALLREQTAMVSVDRLGYGYSDYGVAETDLRVQADFIRFVCQQYPANTIWLVGHSFGGPIAAKLAMDHPGEVHGMVMIAPVNDPDTEQVFWFSGFAKWSLTRWMMSGALRVSGDEKYAHIEALRKMEPGWANLALPVLHVHGMTDYLADPANMPFSKQRIDPRYLRTLELENMGHLIPFTQFDLTRDILLDVLEETYWQN